jgi:hypothetical protein
MTTDLCVVQRLRMHGAMPPFPHPPSRYCNVDDKALLGNDSVRQQRKRSDRRYAMTQYTRVNNGGEDVFCVVVAVVISRV